MRKIMLTAYVERKHYDSLKFLAANTEISFSEYIRQAIDLLLEKHRKTLHLEEIDNQIKKTYLLCKQKSKK